MVLPGFGCSASGKQKYDWRFFSVFTKFFARKQQNLNSFDVLDVLQYFLRVSFSFHQFCWCFQHEKRNASRKNLWELKAEKLNRMFRVYEGSFWGCYPNLAVNESKIDVHVMENQGKSGEYLGARWMKISIRFRWYLWKMVKLFTTTKFDEYDACVCFACFSIYILIFWLNF